MIHVIRSFDDETLIIIIIIINYLLAQKHDKVTCEICHCGHWLAAPLLRPSDAVMTSPWCSLPTTQSQRHVSASRPVNSATNHMTTSPAPRMSRDVHQTSSGLERKSFNNIVRWDSRVSLSVHSYRHRDKRQATNVLFLLFSVNDCDVWRKESIFVHPSVRLRNHYIDKI